MLEFMHAALNGLSDASLFGIAVVFVLLLVSFGKSMHSLFAFPRRRVPDAPRCGGDAQTPVTVFVFPGLLSSISGSPFSTKLLTYLRLAGVPFRIGQADMSKAPKGKFPFIEHGGRVVADTQLIIRYLEATFGVGRMSKEAVKQLAARAKGQKSTLAPLVPCGELSAGDRAHSDLVRVTCDEVLYWGLVSSRWLGTEGVAAREANWHATVAAYFGAIPWLVRGAVCAMIRKCVWTDLNGQGLARHSPADQAYLAMRLLDALEQSLRGRFVLGNGHMCEADCSLFGLLNCMCEDTHWPSPLTRHIREKCPRLWEYNGRLREEVFGDKAPGGGFPADDLVHVAPVAA